MRMRSFRIMEALSGVDEELLDRCEGERRSYPIWRHVGTWAAALCLVAVGAASWGGYQLMRAPEYDSSGSSGGTANQMQQEAWQEPQEDMQQESFAVEMAEEGDAAGTRGAYPEEERVLEDNLENSAGAIAESDGMGNGGNIVADGTGETAEMSMDKEDASTEKSCFPVPDNMTLRKEFLTLEEALDMEGLGIYVPQSAPEGYVFQEAFYYPEDYGNLTVAWSRGTDSIIWNIREEGESVAASEDTVFTSGDLSLEVIRSRMVSGEDAGDAGTPRGCFKVLYPEGVLVSFEGNGTAEEIWEMFCFVEMSE